MNEWLRGFFWRRPAPYGMAFTTWYQGKFVSGCILAIAGLSMIFLAGFVVGRL